MKILFVHNNYGSNNSGEEHAAQGLADLLTQNGHCVEWYRKSSDVIGSSKSQKFSAFFSGFYNPNAIKELEHKIEEFKPDIIQIQNLYPFISPGIIPAIKKMGIPIVMRCPNYRLFCPTGLHLDPKGRVCEKCLSTGRELNGIINNCENNYFKSIGYSLRNLVARIFWGITREPDAFIVQTEFQKQKFIDNGIPENKLFIVPGLTPEIHKREIAVNSKEYVSFIGRVSIEKGIKEFLEAAKELPQIDFAVIGAIQESDLYLKEQSSSNVSWKGFVAGKELDLLFQRSKIVVVPGKWYEGFPNVITRAMKHGKPVITSDLGAMASIIDHEENGLLVEPGNSKDLKHAIDKLYNNSSKMTEYGTKGRLKSLKLYSEDKVYKNLLNVYSSVLT